ATCNTCSATAWACSCAAAARTIASTLARPIVAPEFVGCVSVAIRRVAAVLWVVLPTIALASASSTVHVSIRVSVGGSIKVIVVVEFDVAVVPIAIAPVAAGPGTQRKSGCAPRQPHAGIVPGIGIGIIGVGRRRRSV